MYNLPLRLGGAADWRSANHPRERDFRGAGEVVAMSVLKASNLDGVSFGIPIDTVVECVPPPP